MNYIIIDDFLSKTGWEIIHEIFTSPKIPWSIQNGVSGTENDNELDFYFFHKIYDSFEIKNNIQQSMFYGNNTNPINSPLFSLINPILEKLNWKNIYRIKANLYPRTEKIRTHASHKDYEEKTLKCKGAIYYINSNDGFTILEDKIKINSIANRLLIFDANKFHNSTNCTDKKYRLNINFNYD